MNVYIFGAGASAGSQRELSAQNPLKAPLIDSLFDDIYSQCATDVGLSKERIAELKELLGNNSIEEWLTEQWENIGSLKSKEALNMIRKLFGDLALYIWRLTANVSTSFNEQNLYNVFLRKLAEQDTGEEKAFINFNYDLMLDKALAKTYGLNLSGTMNNYTTPNYLKPHGSVNWFINKRSGDPKINEGDRGYNNVGIVLNRVSSSMFNGENLPNDMSILDPENIHLQSVRGIYGNFYYDGTYGYPLVLLPLSSKLNDLVDGFVERLQPEFKRIFSDATNIYVIGYRANDRLFEQMISDAPKGTKLHIVGLSDAEDIQERILKKFSFLDKGDVYSNGFEGFIESIV